MRLPVLALILASLAPLAAHGQALQGPAVQDRYDAPGPQPPPAEGAPLRGPQGQRPTRTAYLTWTGKSGSLRGPEGDSDGLRGAMPLNTATGLAVRGANPKRFMTSPPAAASTSAAPPPHMALITSAAQPQRLPASLYDRGYVEPSQAARPTVPVQQGPALSSAAGLSEPQAQPQAQAQAQPQVQAQNGQGGPRFYSLHREYGLQPDPVPPAEPSVLALSPAVAQAMADYKDDGSPIDLAGQDQADLTSSEQARNAANSSSSGSSSGSSSSSSSTSSNGQATSTYTIKP